MSVKIEIVQIVSLAAYYGSVFGACYGVGFLSGAFVEGYNGAVKPIDKKRISQMIRQKLPIHSGFIQK